MRSGRSNLTSSVEMDKVKCTIVVNGNLCVFYRRSRVNHRQLSSGTSHIATFLPKRYRERNQLCT